MAGNDQQQGQSVRTIEYGFDPNNPAARNETFVPHDREHSLSRDRSRERYAEPSAASAPVQSKTEDLIRNGTPDQMIEALRAKREEAERSYDASKIGAAPVQKPIAPRPGG